MKNRGLYPYAMRYVLIFLCVAALGSGCARNTKNNAVEDVANTERNAAAARVEGDWIVDGYAFFERELPNGRPEFIDRLVDARRMGYSLHDGEIEFRAASEEGDERIRGRYEIVSYDETNVVLRVIELPDPDADDPAPEENEETTEFRFEFADETHADQYAIYDGEEDPDASPFPLVRVSADAYEAHFDFETQNARRPQPEPDEKTQRYLDGAWILDGERLRTHVDPDETLDPVAFRFLQMFLQFEDGERMTMGAAGEAEGPPMTGAFRAVRMPNDDAAPPMFEFYEADDAERKHPYRWTVDVIDENHMAVAPEDSPEDVRFFERVNEEQLQAFRARAPENTALSERDEKKYSRRARGFWMIDIEKTLEGSPDDSASEELAGVFLGFVMDGVDTWSMHLRQDDMGQERYMEYTVLNADGDVALVRLFDPSVDDVQELVITFQGEDELLVHPPVTEIHSPEYIAGERVVMKKVPRKTFEETFGKSE